MLPRVAPDGGRGRGRGRGTYGGRGRGGSAYGGGSERGGGSEYGFGRGRGRGRGGSEYGGGSERGGGPSDYGYGLGRGNPGAGRGRARGYRAAPHGGVDHGGFRGRGHPSRGRGVVVEASSPAVGVGGDIVEAGSNPTFTLPTLSSGRTGPLPAEHVEATGVRRREYGAAGRVIKLRSNHVEVKLDQKTWYHYDGMHLSYSWEDKLLKTVFDTVTIQSVIIRRRGQAEESRSMARNHQIIRTLQTEVEARLTARPGVYDGRKNLFTSFKLEFESDAHEAMPMSTDPLVEGAPPPAEFTVFLSLVREINPEVLQRFVRGEQSMDNDVSTAITALNIAVRMKPCSMGYPFNARSFFTNQDTKPIPGGVILWRGYFQSVRPAINRILINVNISTGAMYKHGKLIPLCLDFLGRSKQPQVLTASQLPGRELRRLQNFLKGIKVTTPYCARNRNRQRLVHRLTPESARDRTFDVGDGRTVTVMEYFHTQLNIQLHFPDLICVELASGAVIPLELCEVPAGQLVRKEMSPDQIRSILDFSGLPPRHRESRIRDGLDNVLQYGQSQYVREFGIHVPTPTQLVELDGRIITPPRLIYNQESRRPNIRPENGVWNMLEKIMSEPVEIPNWLLVIYEGTRRFNQRSVGQMIRSFVEACVAVGIKINPEPALVRWEQGQGNIAQQLRAACNECQRSAKAAPSLIVAVLPEGGGDIYSSVKNFGDVMAGIPTQCMKASKCFNARPQYYANITLKVNMKLGGVNVIPDRRDVPWLTDPANPTIIMGGDMSHPPPGSRRGPGGYPSYTSLVGSINSTGTKYVSTMGVQDSLHELIEDLENMCIHVFTQFREAMGKLPKRILFYRDGVSEAEFGTVIQDELKFIRNACARLDFNPTITFIVVTKDHKVVFFPRSNNDGDQKGNCHPGTVIDSDVVDPVETDYYLYGHAGLLGTSKPAHYTVLVDENGFKPDGIQSLSYALCHVYARCTRSVSLPAPIFYAHNVCTRAKNHYEPQQVHRLFSPDMTGTEDDADQALAQGDNQSEFQNRFQQAHERQARRMYFV
ncbi:Piwi domain-containing protein [Russula aff. rugulosa BPL654]|nr:Piwi domain-containing protein [Russula aff. rugulosa BPL654]